MTKELKREAEEYCANNCGDCYGCHKKYRKNKNCERIKSMIKTYLASAEPREKRIKQLEEANTTLATMNNSMWIELEKKRAESQGITNRLHELIRAREIIKKFYDFVNNGIEYDPEHPQEHTDLWNELCKEAEQFIKEE